MSWILLFKIENFRLDIKLFFVTDNKMSNITEEKLQNFCSVTGANVDRARFFLESANGNLDVIAKIFIICIQDPF